MAFSYRQVKDLYDVLASAGATSKSLPEWSDEMNQMTGTDLYGEGLHDNFIKRGSVGIDRLLEASGVPDLTGAFGRSVGEAVGASDAGESVGRGLPRMAVNFLPVMGAEAMTGFAATPFLAAAGLAGTGALSGAETYTQTGSPAAGLLSGVTAAALPWAAGKAEQGILSRLGAREVSGPLTNAGIRGGTADLSQGVSAVRQLYPETFGQKAGAFLGGQAAAAGIMEGSGLAQDALSGQPLHNPFSVETALNLTLGQLPFAALHLGKSALGKATSSPTAQADLLEAAISSTRKAMTLAKAQEDLKRQTPLEKIPKVVQPEVIDPQVDQETKEILAKVRGEQAAIVAKPEITAEDAARLQELQAQDDSLTAKSEPTATSALGVEQQPTDDKVALLGRQIGESDRSRTIAVSDSPQNPEELRGRVVNYSKGKYEVAPTLQGEDTLYTVPRDWHTVLPVRGEVPATPHPDLPAQAKPASSYFDHITALDKLETQISSVKTPADLQKAIVDLKAIQETAGMQPINDFQLKRVAEKIGKLEASPKVDPVAAALRREAAKARRKVEAIQAVMTESPSHIIDEQRRSADPILAAKLATETSGTKMSNEGTGPAPVVALPKGANDEIGNFLDEVMSGQQAKYDAAQSFEAWQKNTTSKDLTSVPLDAERFQTFWKMKQAGDLSANLELSDKEVEHFNDTLREQGLDVKDPSVLKDFPERDHVLNWDDAVSEAVAERLRKQSDPDPFAPEAEPTKQLPAGGPFVWNLAPYDEIKNRLGGKHPIKASGDLSVESLRTMGGRGKPLQASEIEMMQALDKVVGGNAFDGKGNVNLKRLTQVLKDNPVVVEAHTYGQEGKATPEKARHDELMHWYDTIEKSLPETFKAWEENESFTPHNLEDRRKLAIEAENQGLSKENAEKYAELMLLKERGAESVGTGPKATSYYNQISPFDTKKFPVVRVDVSLPKTSKTYENWKKLNPDLADSTTKEQWLKRESDPDLWSPDNLHENLPNTLGWAMVQFVPMGGETVMFVGEQQSRWGQTRSKDEKVVNKNLETFDKTAKATDSEDYWTVSYESGDGKKRERHFSSKNFSEKEALQMAREDEAKILTQSHPLLEAQHILVLKAAIAEAERRGVTKMVLSDGETAMMTEGHDKQSEWYVKYPDGTKHQYENEETAKYHAKQSGGEAKVETAQEGGMRLHYDTTLPSATRRLTGDEGQAVDLGVHKNAQSATLESLMDQGLSLQESQANLEKNPGGSPVFKNPDGSPKSSVTGRLYDLTRAQDTFSRQGGFTLGDPTRAPEVPFDPQEPKDALVAKALTGDGHQVIEFLARSANDQVRAITEDLRSSFPQLLSKVTSGVYDIAGSHMTRGEDRTAQLKFSPDIVSMRPDARDLTVLHELIHGLTVHELEDPSVRPELVDQLTKLREKTISALPENLKVLYKKAVREDWMRKYANGEVDGKSLGPDVSWGERMLIYSVLNNKEFVGQAHSSPQLRAFLQQIDGKTGVWKSFVNWTKSLLRLGDKISNTALGEVMELSHQLMAQGEYMLSFKDFGERYFENRGQGGTYGEAQTQRALGIVGESAAGISRDELIGSLSAGEGRFNPDLKRARNKLDQAFAERGEDFQALSSVLDELGHEPSVRGMDEFVETALSEGRDLQDAMDLVPPVGARFIFEKLRDHKDVLSVIAAGTAKKNQSLINIGNPDVLRGPVSSLLKRLEQVLKNEERQTRFAQELVGLNGVDPTVFAANPSPEAEAFMGDKPDKKQSWWSYLLRPMAQTARAIPEAAELISKGFQLAPNIRRMSNEALKIFGMNTESPHLDVIDHDSVAAAQKVFSNKKLENAANRWIFENNDANRDAVTMLPATDPKVAKALEGLTQEQKDLVHDIVAKQGRSTQVLNRLKLDKMQEIAAVNGAGLLSDTGMKTRDNLGLADSLLNGLLHAQDPLTQMQSQAEIASVQARLTPEQFLNLLKFSQGEAEKIQGWKAYFDKNPFWATASRTEQYLVRYTKGGKPKLGQASSVKEARDLIEKAGGREIEIKDQWKGREDEPFSFPNFPVETAKRMEQIEENQIQMLKQKGVLDEEGEKEYRRTSAVSQILREATQQTSLPGVTPPARLLSQGAEDLPFLWNHIANAQRESAYWSRALLRAQARTYLKDPELAGNEELRGQLATHFENLLHPDPQAAQKMTRLASTWFLGFNLASVLINAAQPFVTHVSELTAMTGKPIDSYRRVLRALDELGGKFLGKRDWATDEHRKFMEDAVRDSEVGVGMYDEQAEAEESTATKFKQAMMKNKVQDLGQRLGSAAGSYSNAAMWVFQHGERVNARAALLAGFDLAREGGASYEEAKQEAYLFNKAVNYSGGRAQRPVGAFSGRGAFPRTVAMLGTSMQSYVLGTTFQIARYLQKGQFRPQGLKPHEVYAARKAAVQMLGTQFAAAGLLGLPFASGAVALLNQLFPDLELPKKLREGVASFLSSDKENGSVLTDVAMTGVPSMLGWDLQSRLSMGNTLPGVSEVNGFQPENLMGPAGNIVKNFVNGVQGWAKGQPNSKFLPPAIAKLVDLGTSALNDSGAIRDYRGRPLSEPSVGEHIGQLLGFQPKRLSDQNAASRIAYQADQVQNQREGQFRVDLAKEALRGNFGTVRTSIQQRLRDDKTYNAQDAVRAIARSAEDLSFPRDLRREGSNNSSRNQLLSSFGNLNPASPSEEVRFLFRQGIEQRLGLPPTRSAGELQIARLMDQLRMAQPTATRVELRAAATAALRRQHPQLLLDPQE